MKSPVRTSRLRIPTSASLIFNPSVQRLIPILLPRLPSRWWREGQTHAKAGVGALENADDKLKVAQ